MHMESAFFVFLLCAVFHASPARNFRHKIEERPMDLQCLWPDPRSYMSVCTSSQENNMRAVMTLEGEGCVMADERYTSLLACLATEGVELRADSQLCKAFLQGTLDPSYTPAAVAHTCALHKYLFEYTPYMLRCQAILPQVAMQLAPSLGSYSAAWKFVKTSETPLIKAAVLAECGVPSRWPWLPVTEAEDAAITSAESDCSTSDMTGESDCESNLSVNKEDYVFIKQDNETQS